MCTLVADADGEETVPVQGEAVEGKSLSSQFCSQPKTTLKRSTKKKSTDGNISGMPNGTGTQKQSGP